MNNKDWLRISYLNWPKKEQPKPQPKDPKEYGNLVMGETNGN